MKLNTLSSDKPERAEGKFGDLTEHVTKILDAIPDGEAKPLKDIVDDLCAVVPDLPSQQAYTRVSQMTKRKWFQEKYVKVWDDKSTPYIGHKEAV